MGVFVVGVFFGGDRGLVCVFCVCVSVVVFFFVLFSLFTETLSCSVNLAKA